MSNKLSNSDRQRVSDALTECARKTKDIDDPVKLADAAYSILSDKLGDRPGLFKAACQVYNSCKSIHKLSEASDDTRGNSFSILNVQDMSDRLQRDNANAIRKAASVPAKFTINKIEETTEQLVKTASADRTIEPELKLIKAPRLGISDAKRFIREELEDIESLLRKSASQLRNAEMEYADSFDMFVSAFATESTSVRKEAAARLYANFNTQADALIQEFGSVRPMQKLASESYNNKYVGTPSLPDTAVCRLAKIAMDNKVALDKQRSDYDTIVNELAEATINYSREYMAMHKRASEALLAGTALGGLSKVLGFEETKKDDIHDAVFTTDAMNRMLAHSYKRSFIRAATQKAIAKYSLDKIVPAFNRAVAKLPANTRMIPATANQQLIESLMIDELAKGSVPSGNDAEIIANLAESVGKLRTNKGMYEGNYLNDKQTT